ncbi:hypothetical protein J6590_018230 [Homalodisca vitripennis]|nr:hypothetical protein J6590_018230 [Homalodisca vitripennis]
MCCAKLSRKKCLAVLESTKEVIPAKTQVVSFALLVAHLGSEERMGRWQTRISPGMTKRPKSRHRPAGDADTAERRCV